MEENELLIFETIEKLLEYTYPTYRYEKIAENFYRLSRSDEVYLIFLKNIRQDIEIYNEEVVKSSFGPEKITADDLFIVQKKLESEEIQKCIYILHSEKTKRTEIIEEILYDKYYMKWRG